MLFPEVGSVVATKIRQVCICPIGSKCFSTNLLPTVLYHISPVFLLWLNPQGYSNFLLWKSHIFQLRVTLGLSFGVIFTSVLSSLHTHQFFFFFSHLGLWSHLHWSRSMWYCYNPTDLLYKPKWRYRIKQYIYGSWMKEGIKMAKQLDMLWQQKYFVNRNRNLGSVGRTVKIRRRQWPWKYWIFNDWMDFFLFIWRNYPHSYLFKLFIRFLFNTSAEIS